MRVVPPCKMGGDPHAKRVFPPYDSIAYEPTFEERKKVMRKAYLQSKWFEKMVLLAALIFALAIVINSLA